MDTKIFVGVSIQLNILSHIIYWSGCGSISPNIDHHLLGLGHIEEWMILPTPLNKIVYQVPILLLLYISDSSDHHTVVG